MRHLLLTAIAVTAALIAGCTKTTGNTDNAATDNTDGQIDSTSVRATLMESTRAYKFGLDGDSCYLTMSARVEWPREIGDAHLAKLSDTLIGAAFPSGKGLTVQALKAADVKLQKLYAPPSETNFGGGLLSGTQSACDAACAAFGDAVAEVAGMPKAFPFGEGGSPKG